MSSADQDIKQQLEFIEQSGLFSDVIALGEQA